MKLIFTYDNTDLKNLGRITATNEKAVKEIHVLTVEGEKRKHLYDVAVEIKKETADGSTNIIFIDQYLECADEGFEWLQCNVGIALMKFLRMMEVKSHIVLISPFEPYELIKQSPANLIVSSKGISFTKYLHEFSKKSLKEIETLAVDTFNEKQNLKPYIMAEFSLPEDERHNWANWWGIDRLWNVHRVVEREKYGLTERWNLKEYPNGLKSKLKALRNREALFLYGHKERHIVTTLLELNENAIKLNQILQLCNSAKDNYLEILNTHQSTKANKDALIKNLAAQIALIDKHLPHLNGRSESFVKIRAKNFERIAKLFTEISDLENKLMEVKQVTQSIQYRISNEEKKLEELNQDLVKEEERYLTTIKDDIEIIETEIQGLQSKILSLSIPALRSKLQKKSPEILYIDDQADEGWSNIFRHIIYNKEEKELFKVIQPKETDKINTQYFTDVVCPEITSHKPDLILLDLRLNKESGIRIEVENLSGAILLKEIRKQFPGIPVLMTTASNKLWSYEALQRIGCDAFWTKEGIDTGMTEHDSVKNYLRFAELVNILTDNDYSFLKEYYDEVKKLEEKEKNAKHWWQEKRRFKKDELPEIESGFVYDILKDTPVIFKEFIRNKIIKQTDNPVWNEWFYASLVIQNLGKIIEKLHYGGAEVSVTIMDYREDICGKQLFLKRHEASHIELTKNLKQDDAKEYMKAMLSYLNNRDYCPKPGLKIVGKIELK